MLISFVKIILVIFMLGTIAIGAQLAWVYLCTKKANYGLQAWQHIVPGADFKVLFAGDSTAVGTGLDNNSYSTAGLFSKEFPWVSLENHSHNGLRLKGLEVILKTLQGKKFDLAVLQIGANDILDFTPMSQIREDEHEVLDLTKQIATRIIILHSGDIGQAPLIIWPFSWVYTWRSLKVREIYILSQDGRVSYIDIYNLNKGMDLKNVYAKDYLHLNKEGYAMWYSYIRSQLQRLDWLPKHSSLREGKND